MTNMKAISTLLLLIFFLEGSLVSGMSASPFAFEEYQPDGGRITVRLHGDKDTAILTDLDGTYSNSWPNLYYPWF
jgi:hypothetical protein